MAIAPTQPQKRRVTTAARPLTGSMLFPDLVWAHWEWQRAAHPHTFRGAGRARRLLARAARLNGRRTQRNQSHLNQPSEGELQALFARYESEAAAFQSSEGTIIRAYWCTSEASAVVLTKKKSPPGPLPRRKRSDLRLHRATDWVTADAPAIAELLHSGDTLAIRINEILPPDPRSIAMEWVFSEQSYLLGFVERMRGRPSPEDTASVVARHRVEIDRIERYYDRAAKKTARIQYFVGMILGLGAVAVLGALVPFILKPFVHLDLHSDGVRNFYACFGAGAVGAMVSVMTRMRQEDGVSLDYEVGRALIVMLGAFRPVLGAIFGVMTYFALESGFLNIMVPGDRTNVFFYYALFAFVAGFSERFAHVIIGSADLTVSKALTTPPAEQGSANGRSLSAGATHEQTTGQPRR
jgi:hypothetical protein